MNEILDLKQAIERLNAIHEGIGLKMKSTIQDAIEAGAILLKVKDMLNHGDFIGWINNNCVFNKSTAYNYIKLYEYRSKVPSVGNLQEAYKKIEQLEAHEKSNEYQKAKARIEEYIKTGIKPEGWRRGTDDKLYQERIESDQRIAKMKERIAKEDAERQKKADEQDRDFEEQQKLFDQVMSGLDSSIQNSKKRLLFKERIRVSHEGISDPFIDAIMDYLEELDDDSRRIEACYNIIKVCKNIAIEIQQGGK